MLSKSLGTSWNSLSWFLGPHAFLCLFLHFFPLMLDSSFNFVDKCKHLSCYFSHLLLPLRTDLLKSQVLILSCCQVPDISGGGNL